MIKGPSTTAKISRSLVHIHPLKKGKVYTISSIRDASGSAQIAVMFFMMAGRKRDLFFKVETLVPGVKYTIEFTAKAGESLMLTYWEKAGTRWKQMKSDKFIHKATKKK
jgi:hypothetical protein